MNYLILAAIYLIALVLYCMACAPTAAHGGFDVVFVNPTYKQSNLPDPSIRPSGYDPVEVDPRRIPEQYTFTSPRTARTQTARYS